MKRGQVNTQVRIESNSRYAIDTIRYEWNRHAVQQVLLFVI